ncbi:hypothetical protein F5887DRAFT_982943 [Amanita rubescens]|nr:hypothetical protein F5887DRAFT_982943 [Amanita rubescens]
MSESVKGTIKGSGKNFAGRFTPKGYSVHLYGTLDPPLPPFSVSEATLQYNDVAHLDGTYTIAIAAPSFVGEAKLSLKLINAGGVELTITGVLDNPIPEKIPVSGTARWFLVCVLTSSYS